MSEDINILVVDDEPMFLQLYQLHIQRTGYQVCTAENGLQAWDILSDPSRSIDLIISDVQMPDLDGYGLCRRVRENPATHNTPFIFVSGLVTLEEKLKGYAAGGDDYLTKPVIPEELVQKIRHTLAAHLKSSGLSQQLAESFNAAMQAMTYSSQLGQVIDFFKKSLISDSLEQIAHYLFEFMEPHGLHCTIQFHTPGGLKNFSPQGEVSPLESSVIELARQKPRFFDFGARTIINYADFSLLIKNMPVDNPEQYGTFKDTLGNLCEAIEARVKVLISEDRNKQREEVLRAIETTMQNISSSLEQIQRTNVTAIEDMIGDIDEAMISLGLTEVQEENIRHIATTTLGKVDEAFNQGAQLQNQFADVQRKVQIAFGI